MATHITRKQAKERINELENVLDSLKDGLLNITVEMENYDVDDEFEARTEDAIRKMIERIEAVK